MPTVPVYAPAQDKRYNIHIGSGLLKHAAEHLSYKGRRIVVVADENTAPLYSYTLLEQLHLAGNEASVVVLPAGETTKCPEQLSRLYDAFLDAKITRSDAVIALGGGVIGDLTGYAAATFLRGVPFVQIPTTLLAQVDSSVGGKVAINHERGKNLLGAFYQPEMVLIDTDTLKTLPDREFGAGLGEVIKYGCIADKKLFEHIEKVGSREALIHSLPKIIARCCDIKSRYVKEDPFDFGVRMQLNFGHTLAHAIESQSGYGTVLHGEAVCIGMVEEARWGEKLGVTPAGTSERIRSVLASYQLPTDIPPALTKADLAAKMAFDKKALGRTINLIHLIDIGACFSVPHSTDELASLL